MGRNKEGYGNAGRIRGGCLESEALALAAVKLLRHLLHGEDADLSVRRARLRLALLGVRDVRVRREVDGRPVVEGERLEELRRQAFELSDDHPAEHAAVEILEILELRDQLLSHVHSLLVLYF